MATLLPLNLMKWIDDHADVLKPPVGKPRDMPIREGEILLLPAHTRHSPQRPADTVGLVIERIRHPGELDAFEWYCEKCETRVHRREVAVTDIVRDLPPVFDEYYGNAELRTCPACGHQNPGKD